MKLYVDGIVITEIQRLNDYAMLIQSAYRTFLVFNTNMMFKD